MSTSDSPNGVTAASLPAYPEHPYAAIFPMISGEEYDKIKEDIRIFGQKTPIVLHDGKVLDGRNRQQMILELALTPAYREFDPATEGDALEFVLSNNLHRRHLSQGQRAAIATDFEQIFADEAKARAAKIADANRKGTGPGYDQEEGGGDDKTGGQPGAGDTHVDTSGEFNQTGKPQGDGANGSKPGGKKGKGDSDATRSRTKAAKVMGVSARAVGTAKKLKATDAKAFEQVKAGTKSLNAAATGKATPGSKAAEELDAALAHIEKVCGKPLANAIREGARLKKRADVIAYASMTDKQMLDIRNLVELGWPLKKAALYKAETLVPTHRIIDAITRAAAQGEKSFSQVIETPEMGCDWEIILKPKARPKAPTFEEKVKSAKVGEVIEGEPEGKKGKGKSAGAKPRATKPAGAAPKKKASVKGGGGRGMIKA